MDPEWIPTLVVMIEIGLFGAGYCLYRINKFSRMTPREREWTLKEEKRIRDHFAGRD
jgi:hypothetical protein